MQEGKKPMQESQKPIQEGKKPTGISEFFGNLDSAFSKLRI